MEIWHQIRKDKEQGAERLVSEYGGRIYAAAVLLCSNDHDAEELTFRTLDQAVKKIRLYNPQWRFFTWLYTIMLNFHRMSHRRRQVELVPMGGAADLPERPCEEFADMLSQTADDEVEGAVRTLSEPLREVVMLRYFADRTVDEISMLLGIPPGTVKSRLHHAREALFNKLSHRMSRKGDINGKS